MNKDELKYTLRKYSDIDSLDTYVDMEIRKFNAVTDDGENHMIRLFKLENEETYILLIDKDDTPYYYSNKNTVDSALEKLRSLGVIE